MMMDGKTETCRKQLHFVPTRKQMAVSVGQIPVAVDTVIRLLMMDGNTVRNM